MASRSRNSPHKSVEERVFAKSFAFLQTAVTPVIDELTTELYSAELIERGTRDDHTGNAKQKAFRVLSSVEINVDRNPQNFYLFLDILERFSTLSDIVCRLRDNCSAATAVPLPPAPIHNTCGGPGRSKLCVGVPLNKYRGPHPLAHTQRQHPENADTLASERAQIQADSSTAEETTQLLPGVGVHGHNFLSESAVLRHAQVPTSTALAATDENGSFATVSFLRSMSSGVALSYQDIVSSTENLTLSTIEERTPVQRLSHNLDVKYDVRRSLNRSISGSSDDSWCSSMGEAEMKLIVQLQETLELYKQTQRKNVDLKQKLKVMEKRLKRREKEMIELSRELELTLEEASEKASLCDGLTEDIAQKEIQIQSLKRQLLSSKVEHKRLTEHLELVARQAQEQRKLLQKYDQISAEKEDDYYMKYCEAIRDNEHLRAELSEYESKIELLEKQVDYLLQKDPLIDTEDSLEGQDTSEDQDCLKGRDRLECEDCLEGQGTSTSGNLGSTMGSACDS